MDKVVVALPKPAAWHRMERECQALHSALAEACHRLHAVNNSRHKCIVETTDLLAVLRDPDKAPRPWDTPTARQAYEHMMADAGIPPLPTDG